MLSPTPTGGNLSDETCSLDQTSDHECYTHVTLLTGWVLGCIPRAWVIPRLSGLPTRR